MIPSESLTPVPAAGCEADAGGSRAGTRLGAHPAAAPQAVEAAGPVAVRTHSVTARWKRRWELEECEKSAQEETQAAQAGPQLGNCQGF